MNARQLKSLRELVAFCEAEMHALERDIARRTENLKAGGRHRLRERKSELKDAQRRWDQLRNWTDQLRSLVA